MAVDAQGVTMQEPDVSPMRPMRKAFDDAAEDWMRASFRPAAETSSGGITPSDQSGVSPTQYAQMIQQFGPDVADQIIARSTWHAQGGGAPPQPGTAEYFKVGRRGIAAKQKIRTDSLNAVRDAIKSGDAETVGGLLGRKVRYVPNAPIQTKSMYVNPETGEAVSEDRLAEVDPTGTKFKQVGEPGKVSRGGAWVYEDTGQQVTSSAMQGVLREKIDRDIQQRLKDTDAIALGMQVTPGYQAPQVDYRPPKKRDIRSVPGVPGMLLDFSQTDENGEPRAYDYSHLAPGTQTWHTNPDGTKSLVTAKNDGSVSVTPTNLRETDYGFRDIKVMNPDGSESIKTFFVDRNNPKARMTQISEEVSAAKLPEKMYGRMEVSKGKFVPVEYDPKTKAITPLKFWPQGMTPPERKEAQTRKIYQPVRRPVVLSNGQAVTYKSGTNTETLYETVTPIVTTDANGRTTTILVSDPQTTKRIRDMADALMGEAWELKNSGAAPEKIKEKSDASKVLTAEADRRDKESGQAAPMPSSQPWNDQPAQPVSQAGRPSVYASMTDEQLRERYYAPDAGDAEKRAIAAEAQKRANGGV